MRVLALMLLAVCCVAQEVPSECKPIEYAELKDMTKEQLYHRYCMQSGLFDIWSKACITLHCDIDRTCLEAWQKTQGVLERKYQIKEVNCKELEKRWKKENDEYNKKHEKEK